MFERIKTLISYISHWSIPAKFLLSAVLSAVGGAGLLSYLIEYATYTYSLYYGFRPPVEGIPYLRSTVALGSFFLLLAGALVGATFIFTLSKLVKLSNKMIRLKHPNLLHIREINNFKFLKLLIFSSLSTAFFYFLIASLLCSWTYVCRPDYWATNPRNIFSFALGPTLTLIIFRYPKSVWLISIGYVAFFYISIVLHMFKPEEYANFLRFTGFGGGIEITLELFSDEMPDEEKTTNGFLMLRTANALIIYDLINNQFREIQADKIRQIIYPAGGLDNISYHLPR